MASNITAWEEAMQLHPFASRIPAEFDALPAELKLDIIDLLAPGPTSVMNVGRHTVTTNYDQHSGLQQLARETHPIHSHALKAWYHAINNYTRYIKLELSNNRGLQDPFAANTPSKDLATDFEIFRRVVIDVPLHYQCTEAKLEVIKILTFDLRCGDDRQFKLHSMVMKTIKHPRSYDTTAMTHLLDLADGEDQLMNQFLGKDLFEYALNQPRPIAASLAIISQTPASPNTWGENLELMLGSVSDGMTAGEWRILGYSLESSPITETYEDALLEVPLRPKLGWRGPEVRDGPATLLELGSLDFDDVSCLRPATPATWDEIDHSLDAVYPYWLSEAASENVNTDKKALTWDEFEKQLYLTQIRCPTASDTGAWA